MKDKVFAYVFVGVAAVLLLFAVYKTLFSSKVVPRTDQGTSRVPTQAPVPPTLTPEEIKIYSNVETKSVDITDSAIFPISIVVKKHDQVAFYNKTKGKTITIDGGTWGKIPLDAGENMTQSFKELGTFKYQVAALGLNGEVVVK